MQPQVTIKEYSPKSIVLRVVPDDFFKPYAQHLTNIGGKWGPYLKEPPGSQNVLAGWIFQKSKEGELRNLINAILAGQVPAAPPKYGNTQTVSSAPTFVSSVPTPSIFGTLQHSGLVRVTGAPVTGIPVTRPGYQQIELIKPEVGGTLQLELGGQKYAVKVESIQEEQGVVTSATILLPDGQRAQIAIQKPQWKITGFTQDHTILL